MIYNATKEIQEAFEEAHIKCRTVEAGNTSAVEAGFSGKNAGNFIVRFISSDDDNDVAVRVLNFIKIPEDKRGVVLEAINSLHYRFRYISFLIDDENNLHIQYDIPVSTRDVGLVATEIFLRMVKIVDDAYPLLMTAIWS